MVPNRIAPTLHPQETALCGPSPTKTQNPKSLSYNDTIRDYSLALPSQTETTINHLLTMSPIYSDVSDGFKQILNHPETALTCQVFLMKSIKDKLPTLDISKAELTNGIPELYPVTYDSSSNGFKD